MLGFKNKNQNCIKEKFHKREIVQICSIKKLDNRFFATRCSIGDVGLFSSEDEPDKVHMFTDVDKAENAQSTMWDTHRDSSVKHENLSQKSGGNKSKRSSSSSSSDKDK